jgi:hypothetical protein
MKNCNLLLSALWLMSFLMSHFASGASLMGDSDTSPPGAAVKNREEGPDAGMEQPLPPGKAFPRWSAFSKELQKRKDLVAYYDFQRDDKNPALLINKSPAGEKLNGKIEGARWVKGRFGGKWALEFKRPKSGVAVDIPQEMPVMTVAAWVKVDGMPHRFMSVIASNQWDPTVLFPPSDNAAQNREGSLIFGYVTKKETPDFPQLAIWGGGWNMVAMVCDQPANRVALYFNGKKQLEAPPSHREAIKFGPAMIGGWNPTSVPNAEDCTLDGRMEELMIFDTALSAEEILKIYEGANR